MGDPDAYYFFSGVDQTLDRAQVFLHPDTESYNFSMVSLMSSMQYLSLSCAALRALPSQLFPSDLKIELSYQLI